MISQLWRTAITALYPNVTVFSQNDTEKIMRLIAEQIKFTQAQTIDWKKYGEPIKHYKSHEVITTLEQYLQRPLTNTNRSIYIIFVFHNHNDVIKTDIVTFLKKNTLIHWSSVNLIVWNPAEGYIIEQHHRCELAVGFCEKGNDPSPQFVFKKNLLFYSFMKNKGPFHEFTKAFGLEIFGDDEANTILIRFQNMVPFTSWGRVDWEQFKHKIVVGKDKNDVLPALQKLFKKKFDTKIYICHKEMGAPLMRINLTPETATYQPIWSRLYGTLLFNFESGYVIEVDLQGNITVGLIPSKEN